MQFNGFSKSDFELFNIDGLDARMAAIKEHLQPKFREIGQELCGGLSMLAGQEMYLHIAKHARRTVHAPNDTWLAICDNKRGYKQHPHFQVGLFNDHVFVWLAFIYELPNKKEIAENFLSHIDEMKEMVPKDFVISFDHMKKEAVSVSEMKKEDWVKSLERFRDIKKAELLIGRKIMADAPVLQHGEMFMKLVRDTFQTLFPLYQLSLETRKSVAFSTSER